MKKSNVKIGLKKGFKSILFVLLSVILILSVFTGCLDEAADPSEKRLVDPSGAVASDDYKAIFEDTFIVHMSPVFGENMASYAEADENGLITCFDYAYKGDVVKEFARTQYIGIDGYSEEALAAITEACEEDKAEFDDAECAKASYSVGNSYITCKVVFSDVDNKDSLKELYDLGFIDTKDSDYLSMESCEELWLKEGFVKK